MGGRNLAQKKANAGAITLLRKIYNEKQLEEERGEKCVGGNYGEEEKKNSR